LSADNGKTGSSLLIKDVTAGYGGRPVLRDIDAHVEPGEIVSIVGPNGSGKSTLLKSVVGTVKVTSGSIVLDGLEITGKLPEDVARIGVGYVPQVDDVFGPLSVRENLEMGGYLLPQNQVKDNIDRVLATFPQLARMMNRRAGKLSGGERKMLAFGRVIMLKPTLYVLDEPTANLAPQIAIELLDQHVRRLADTGASVLIVEQRAKAVLGISDRTYVLAGGQVRMEGTPAILSEDPAFVESFLGGSGGAAPIHAAR
jgi:ABC-type branched-subunit amino acid transport system ATPase component